LRFETLSAEFGKAGLKPALQFFNGFETLSAEFGKAGLKPALQFQRIEIRSSDL